MGKKCKNKYRFKIWNDAQRFAEQYKDDVSMIFNPMRPYWCEKHELWHIGHDITERMEYTGNGARILPNTNGTKVLPEDDARYSYRTTEDESESTDTFELNTTKFRD